MSHAKSSGLRKMALTKSGHSKAGSITDMGGIYRTNIYGLMKKGSSSDNLSSPDGALF